MNIIWFNEYYMVFSSLLLVHNLKYLHGSFFNLILYYSIVLYIYIYIYIYIYVIIYAIIYVIIYKYKIYIYEFKSRRIFKLT